MFSPLARTWRLFGTALSFAIVGIGGVLIFPLFSILGRGRRRSLVARGVIRLTFRCVIGLMRAMGVFSYEITGLERLRGQGLLILANHPTLIDIVFLMAFIERADCVAKSALWRNPFTRFALRAAAYVRTDDRGIDLIENCVAAIRGGGNLIVFPEGTRTPTNGTIALGRGAANIAVRAPCNVIPVYIRCVPPMLAKGAKWWRLPSCPSQFTIEVKKEIDIQPFIAAAANQTAAVRRLTDHLQAFFAREQMCHAAL